MHSSFGMLASGLYLLGQRLVLGQPPLKTLHRRPHTHVVQPHRLTQLAQL